MGSWFDRKNDTHASGGGPADRRTDAVAWLRGLQARLRAGEGAEDLGEVVSSMSVALDQVLAEHAGMAEELICAYEQLGIVFEVTRRLPEVQSELAVIDLFVDNLRRSFDTWEVCTVRPGIGVVGGSGPPADGRTFGARVHAMVERACAQRSVAVDEPSASSCDGEASPTSPPGLAAAGVMAAPVFAGGAQVCTIVLVRGAETPPFRAVDMMLVESLATFCGDLILQSRLVRELRTMSIAMVRSLVNAVDQKDEYTCGHSLRVGYYATELGKRLHLREVDLQMLQWAALLHDVGKIGIRDAVLKKEGRLTKEEFDHIKEHPVRSHRVVQQVPQLADALDGILHHHERWDGSGYPSGLRGEKIPLQARIIQMADMFDALTSNRSYRPAFNWEQALGILEEEAGSCCDPELQRVFDHMIREQLSGGPDPGSAWRHLIEQAERFGQSWEQGTCQEVG